MASPPTGQQWPGLPAIDLAAVQRCAARLGAASATPLVLVVMLGLVALLVAPEQPQVQEAICQRHNGVAACRVW